MPLNEDLTKYTECFTAFRDCWMNSILICQHRFIQNWISNYSREHHLHFLGSCRYKLPEIHEDKAIYEKIFEILNKLDIYAFIYIGGNDSMDTIKKLSDYAILTGQTQKFLGVPKTIDNDLALTDHTPGFGSAAKYIGASTKEVIRDALGLTYKKNMITIMEIMGRNAGWLTGATALAKSEDCDGPEFDLSAGSAF